MTLSLPTVVTYFFVLIISLHGTKLCPLYSYSELVLKASTLKKTWHEATVKQYKESMKKLGFFHKLAITG